MPKAVWSSQFAKRAAHICVRPRTLAFSDTRQLVINTGTTIGTFLMVFPMKNT